MKALIFAFAAGVAADDQFQTYKARQFNDPVGANGDPTFQHANCFNTFGQPSGVEISSGVSASMAEGFSFSGRDAASGHLSNVNTVALPAGSCAVAASQDFDLSGCSGFSITQKLKECGKICSAYGMAGNETGCAGFELDVNTNACSLYGGADFNPDGSLPGQCREYPMAWHIEPQCSQKLTLVCPTSDPACMLDTPKFIGTLCQPTSVDPRKYKNPSLVPSKQPLPSDFMRLGVFLKIEYPNMANDYSASADESDVIGATSLCQHLKGLGVSLNGPGITAFEALPEVASSVLVSIECTPPLFNAYRASSIEAGSFAYWLTAPAADADALQATLEEFDCDNPTACDLVAMVTSLEGKLDTALGVSGTQVQFVSKTYREYDKAWTMPPQKFQDYPSCWDADGVSQGVEILPGFTAGVWHNKEMKPETHMPTPVLRWSDFSPTTDNYPVPRGCFPDETEFGTPSNPSLVKKGAHIELLGADCVGNRTENEMLRICMTICAYTDYSGPGTFDNRCVGVNYDEHGWGGHCHLQGNLRVVSYNSAACRAEKNTQDLAGLCTYSPDLTGKATCGKMGFSGKQPAGMSETSIDWCGVAQYISFFCWFGAGNAIYPGPSDARFCPIGQAWDYATELCVSCGEGNYSKQVQDGRLNIVAPRPGDYLSLINTCEVCPPGRECPGNTGCAYDEDISECPPKVKYDYVDCSISGCGKFAACIPDLNAIAPNPCTCQEGTETGPDFATSRSCIPAVASVSQQRVFWTLSMFFFGVGLVLCAVVMNEFWRNRMFSPSYPGGTMWSFAAIAIPDFVLAAMYFIFHFINLLNGEEMATGPCEFFAVVTTMVVIATFCGPPIVGLMTLLTFIMAGKGRTSFKLPKTAVAGLLLLPWLMGLLIGLIARSDDKLGSYRGLMCYNTEWNSFSTGGITLLIFVLSTIVTFSSYLRIACMVRSTLRKSNAGSQADQYFKDIVKRGGGLVGVFLITWAAFLIVMMFNMSSKPVSLTIEMFASLFISVQPIVDAFVLLQTPAVQSAMVNRIHSHYGSATEGSYSSSSSSSSSSGSSSGSSTA